MTCHCGREPDGDSLRLWSEISGELHAMFPDKPMVCVTHKRFIPCCKTDRACIFSTAEYDVEMIREYQKG